MRKLVIFVTAKKKDMYPAELVQPMRDELTAVGFEQINDVKRIEDAINGAGTTLVVVNSVWMCSSKCPPWRSFFVGQRKSTFNSSYCFRRSGS